MPGLIGVAQTISRRQKHVTLVVLGPPEPDGEGGFVRPDVPLVPGDSWARVRPASQSDMEALAAGTVLTQATHLVSLPYHPQITTETIVLVENYPNPDRRLSVLYRGDPDERSAELDLLCSEVVDAS